MGIFENGDLNGYLEQKWNIYNLIVMMQSVGVQDTISFQINVYTVGLPIKL